MIEVILLERVQKLGQMGEKVTVRPGYARNFLLPQKKALRATKSNLAYFDAQKAKLEAENATRRSEASTLAGKLEGQKFVIIRQAGEAGQLFGSVSSRDVAEAAVAGGFAVHRNMVDIATPIKALGLYDVTVHLHPEVTVKVGLNVARSAEEAVLQAKTGKVVVTKTEEVAPAEEVA